MERICKLSNRIIKLRYLVALIAIIVLVCSNLNGSSIGIWDQYFKSTEDSSIIFGTPVKIRSDEWGTTTPEIFSQQYTNQPYSRINNLIRGTNVDISLYPGLPCLDITLLFRPALAGYVFLNNERGLAFYWAFRSIILWLSCFELAGILTEKKHSLSFIFASIVLFSPAVQWWFSAGGLLEMIIGGNYFIVALSNYFISISNKKPTLPWLVLMFFSGGSYLFTLYPGWMVPFGYIYLILTIFIFSKDKNYKLLTKKEVLYIASTGVLLLSSFFCILLRSKDTLNAILSSEYPGLRFTKGGEHFRFLFYNASNMLYNMPGNENFFKLFWGNECEGSGFYDLFPFSLVFTIIILIALYKDKKKTDCILLLGTLVSFLFIVFVSIPIPTRIIRLTLLSFSTQVRTILTLHFLNLLLILRGLSFVLNKDVKFSLKTKIVLFMLLILCTVTVFNINKIAMEDYMNGINMIIVILAFFIPALLLIFPQKTKYFSFILIFIISLSSSYFVNPINIGTGNLYKIDLSKAIREITKNNPNDLWISEENYPLAEYLIMNGARTFNSTQPYPINYDAPILDPANEFHATYNRYAHISIVINHENDFILAKYGLIAQDYYAFYIVPKELKALGVKWLLSKRDLSEYSTKEVLIKPIGCYNSYYINEVIY